MRRATRFVAGALALALARPAVAGDVVPDTSHGITLSGSLRIRGEAIEGQARTGFNDRDQIVSLRTMLLGTVTEGPVKLVVNLEDSRVYGAVVGSAVTTSEVNALEPVQAYAELDGGSLLGAGSNTRLRAGRMLLDIASRRLVSDDDFRNAANAFTGLRADWRSAGGTALTLFGVLPQARRPDDAAGIRRNAAQLDRESFDTRLWAAVLIRPALVGRLRGEFGYYGFAERDAPARPTRDRHLHTLTARLIADRTPGRLDGEVEVMAQIGSIAASLAPGAATLPVRAGFVHAGLGRSMGGAWRPRLSIEFDLASGDGPGRADGRFDTLYGSRRADLGPTGLYAAIGRTNLAALGLKVETDPTRRVDLLGSVRLLRLASATDAFSTTGVRDASGRAGHDAGVQFDDRLRWWVAPKRLRAEVDAVLLAKARFLRTAPNAPHDGNVRYLAVALTSYF